MQIKTTYTSTESVIIGCDKIFVDICVSLLSLSVVLTFNYKKEHFRLERIFNSLAELTNTVADGYEGIRQGFPKPRYGLLEIVKEEISKAIGEEKPHTNGYTWQGKYTDSQPPNGFYY